MEYNADGTMKPKDPQYPKILHKAGGVTIRVNSAEEEKDALSQGHVAKVSDIK